MNINYSASIIELTSAEMKKARVFGSDEYRALREARSDNPTFRIIERKPRRSKADFAKLTMKEIAGYVEKHGSEDQKADFATLTDKSDKSVPFFTVKKWFLNEFPELRQELTEHRSKVQDIIEAAASKAVAAA